MKILVTGAAGFIGFHICKRLIKNKNYIIGVDNFNDYYDPNLKNSRIENLISEKNKPNEFFKIYKADITNTVEIESIFHKEKPDIVVHLAAQAGVRYSINNPSTYIQSNLVGFGNILENCKKHKIEHLLFASSSSVYGGNNKLPYSEDQGVDHPVSLYAATKRSNELMAHAYSHLYNLRCTGLRFFTVYGPWGRPDMALFKFTELILNNKKIEIYNRGQLYRDFTYIDDVVESIFQIIKNPPNNELINLNSNDPSSSWAPYNLFNIGNSTNIKLIDFIDLLEKQLNKKSKKIYKEMQLGDVLSTYADCTKLKNWINYKPKTNLQKGIKEFVDWYKKYYCN